MRKRGLLILLVLMISLTLFAEGQKEAESGYPEKAITVVVATNPGGGTDTSARLVLKYLEKELGVSMPVVNMAGGSGAIGMTDVKNSRPTGYKIAYYHDSLIANYINGTMDFLDDGYDFIGTGLRANSMTLYTNGNKFSNFEEFVAYAKANPGDVIAAAPLATTTRQAMVALEQSLGIQLQKVDVGSAGERIAAMAGGHIDLTIAPFGQISDYINSGDFKVVLQFREGEGDYPTALDNGIDYEFFRFYWMAFPKGVDPMMVETITTALKAVANNPDFIADAKNLDLDPFYLNPEETVALVRKTYEKLLEYEEIYSE